jgi:hypothetical protein
VVHSPSLPVLIYLGVFDWWLSLQPHAHAGSSLADFSTLKTEAIRSSERSVYTRSTRRNIPEGGILHFNIGLWWTVVLTTVTMVYNRMQKIKTIRKYYFCSSPERLRNREKQPGQLGARPRLEWGSYSNRLILKGPQLRQDTRWGHKIVKDTIFLVESSDTPTLTVMIHSRVRTQLVAHISVNVCLYCLL